MYETGAYERNWYEGCETGMEQVWNSHEMRTPDLLFHASLT